MTFQDLDTTKSILITVDESAIELLGADVAGAGKEVPIEDLKKIVGDTFNMDYKKTELNKLFEDLTISKNSILAVVDGQNFTGLPWSCDINQAYVKEASTPIDTSKCYQFVNVGGKYGSYFVYPNKNLVYGTLTVESALMETINNLVAGLPPEIQMVVPMIVPQLIPGLNLIASVEVDFVQSTDITKINITNINQETGLLVTATSMAMNIFDECLEEGAKINKQLNLSRLVRVANCFIKQNTTNVKVIIEYLTIGGITIPKNITVDIDMIKPFLPMVAEYFDGLYLNKEGKVTLMVDVGDDVTIKAVGEELACSTTPNLELLGFKEYIPLPKFNLILPSSMFSLNGKYTYVGDSDTKYLIVLLYSADVKSILPAPLNTDGFKFVVKYTVTKNDKDDYSDIVLNYIDRDSYVYALNNESAIALSSALKEEGVKFEFDYYQLSSLNITQFESSIEAELSKLVKISVKYSDVTRSEDPRGKGIFKINGGVDQELDVYYKYPPEEFKDDSIPSTSPTSSPLPDDATPLPKDKCYLFEANKGEFGSYYVDIAKGTCKGGIVVANALKNIGDVIPPMVTEMMSFDGIFAWAEVKMDYINEGKLTKINVTEILESTFIQFTELKEKSLVSMLGTIAPELGLLNKPIYLSAFLKNVGGILDMVKGFLPDGVVIPDGPLGLDNITQFLPMAYEYFEGMYWSESNKKGGFSVSVPPDTVVNAEGEMIDCSEPQTAGLKETIPLYNYVFAVRNNIPDIKGIFVIDGKTVKAKLNCSDYEDLLLDSMKGMNCYILINYDAVYRHNEEDGYTEITLNKFSDVTFDRKVTVINVEPRDKETLDKMATIMADTYPDVTPAKTCETLQYNLFIDLREVEEDKKDEEVEKILGNLYESVANNITDIFGRVYLNYANIVKGKTGRVNLKNNELKNAVVFSTTSNAEELGCEYIIPPYDGDDDSGNGGGTSDVSTSFFISYFFGFIMIVLGIILM